ncbi:MAG TPA: ABZJ_00895 family protein [Arenimonas sp.]|nr:ABZJ_00895 family protein [Arenimonas sp.]
MNDTSLLKYHLIFTACYLAGSFIAGLVTSNTNAVAALGLVATMLSAYLALRSFHRDQGRPLDIDERRRMLRVGVLIISGLTLLGLLLIKAIFDALPINVMLGRTLPVSVVVLTTIIVAVIAGIQLWVVYYLLNSRGQADAHQATAATAATMPRRAGAARTPARPRLRVLVLGDDAAAHALAWKYAQSPQVQEVLVAPGNAGTSGESKCRNLGLPATDVEAALALVQREAADLIVAGPAAPLAEGLVDRLQALELRVLGPRVASLALEDAGEARRLLAREGIATAEEDAPGRRVDLLHLVGNSLAVELAALEPAPEQGRHADRSPPSDLPADLRQRVAREILDPLIVALARDDREWNGFLGLRLSLDGNGNPRVIGLRLWPSAAEASLAMMRLQGDLAALSAAALDGQLEHVGVRSSSGACLAVGRVAEPEEIGRPIQGLDRRPPLEVKVFHAGTRQLHDHLQVARREVLTVCALGASLAECRLSLDDVAGRIAWPAPAAASPLGAGS